MVRRLFFVLYPPLVGDFSAMCPRWFAAFTDGRAVTVHGLGVARLGHLAPRTFGSDGGVPLIIILSRMEDLGGMKSIFHASSTFEIRDVCLYNVATYPPRTRVRGATLKTRRAIS